METTATTTDNETVKPARVAANDPKYLTLINQAFETAGTINENYLASEDKVGNDLLAAIKSNQLLEEQLAEITDQMPLGLHIGKMISFPVADGRAVYLVEKIYKTTCKLFLVAVGGDCYAYDVVSERGSCPRHLVEQAIKRADAPLGRRKPLWP
jgi:hypothetical protein